jgi:DUF1365 family protein
MGSAFTPPDAAVSLIPGRVFHARLRPRTHRFSYRVAPILIDLDRLDEADSASGIFSVNRRNLVSFHERDHGPCDGTPLRPYVEAQLAARGVVGPLGRVLLLAYPRCLGFVFNPLAVYCAFDRQDRLVGVLYEVRNTFGERHTYVAPVAPESLTKAGLRQRARKAFYVSPFIDLNGAYDFRLQLDEAGVRLRILHSDSDGPLLSTGFAGVRQTLTASSLVAAFGPLPLMTLKVVAGIHWEAMRLWLKGLRLLPRPTSAAATPKAAPPPVQA